MALHAIMYKQASSASVAEDIMFLMMCAMFRIAPLFGGTVYCLKGRSVHPLRFVLLACSNSLHCCEMLAPFCLHGRRVRQLLAWPGNQGAEVFVTLCLQLVWMTAMLWR
jgi:hypothetical protein